LGPDHLFPLPKQLGDRIVGHHFIGYAHLPPLI
jgi:hypothetical protein